MNTIHYAKGLVFELKLNDRWKRGNPDEALLKDTDEAIAATVYALKDQRGSLKDLLKGPRSLLGVPASREFLRGWKDRAQNTLDMVDRFRAAPQGKKKDVLRHQLWKRFLFRTKEDDR